MEILVRVVTFPTENVREELQQSLMSGTNSMAEPGACPCHSEAHARPRPLYIRHSHSTKRALAPVQHQHSNKWLYQHAKHIQQSIAYLYTRHGGSAELAPPAALED